MILLMEFVIFDTENRLEEFIKNDDSRYSPMKIKINEMHLMNKKNFWFETDFKRNSNTLNLDDRYVHVNPMVKITRLKNAITSTIRLTPENFKYNYNSSCLIIYKKFLFFNIIVMKKKIMTRFIGNPKTNKDIPVNGNMYYNSANNIIYIVLEYYK